jgi:hypothetical protein
MQQQGTFGMLNEGMLNSELKFQFWKEPPPQQQGTLFHPFFKANR